MSRYYWWEEAQFDIYAFLLIVFYIIYLIFNRLFGSKIALGIFVIFAAFMSRYLFDISWNDFN